MAILLRLRNKNAILRQGVWMCSDPEIESLLNTTLESWIDETGGPAIGERDPERCAAREVARRVGGRIALRTAVGRKGRNVYLARRQLGFQFDRWLPQSSVARRRRAAAKQARATG